ncbi:hypothetical protein [Halobacillus aidingensis]|uniref:Uncharacterized protein n=1 Tax=Halobacillus aidingensis TaxID=240303 RepID=A0A1H0G9Q9_HALAD|nr:hypothetical protein [Halobacillus aidingensis]SDO03574.1 hypothetical protein SAMN05421677_102260 [Halobacillus aidingensis]
MIRSLSTSLLLVLGFFIAGVAILHQWLITSDIPVSYTAAEALTTHVMFALSTVLFLIASVVFEERNGNLLLGVIFSAIFIANMVIFNHHLGAEYYNHSFAQLQGASMLYTGIVMVLNLYLAVTKFKVRAHSSKSVKNN